MSRIRGLFPILLATVFGVAGGLHTFGPPLYEQQEKKRQERLKKKHGPVTEVPEDMVRATEHLISKNDSSVAASSGNPQSSTQRTSQPLNEGVLQPNDLEQRQASQTVPAEPVEGTDSGK